MLIKQRHIYLRKGHKAFGDTKIRPCIVVSLDVRNLDSETIIVVPCSSNLDYAIQHVRVKLAKGEGGLESDSIALCDQLAAIPKSYLQSKSLGMIDSSRLIEIQYAIAASVGLIL